MNDGANFVPFYPWSEGDRLYASALNAAIANSVSLGGDNKNWRTAYDFGAVGSTATVWHDDTAALNTAFAQTSAEGGGRIYFPGIFYAAGALTVPPNVEIYGNFATGSQQPAPTQSFFQMGGSKLILGSSGLSLGRSCILRNIMVISATAPQTNPTNLTQSQAVIAAMTTAGTGINLTGDNCLIDTVQVLGFNYGIRCVGNPAMNRQMLRNVHGDCINGIHFDTGGDTCRIEGAHFWPYLTAMDLSGGGTGYAGFQRPGVGIYSKGSACTLPVVQCTVFGWQTCFMCDTDSVSWIQCWADGNAPRSAGFATTGACGPCQLVNSVAVANNFGVHHTPSNGAVFYISGGTSINAGGPPGGSTPAAGMTTCVVADGHGPVNCIGAYFNGGQAAFFLGPNSGPNTLIANQYDDANQNWGAFYYVDAAVVPLLTKYGNRVINSPRSWSDSFPPNESTGEPLYDIMPNIVSSLSLVGALNLFAPGSAMQTPSAAWQVPAAPADQKIWDAFATSTSFAMRAVNDTNSAANSWLEVDRSGYTISAINLTAAAIGLNGAVGFNSTPPIAKPNVSGSMLNNPALHSLLDALVGYGLITSTATPT